MVDPAGVTSNQRRPMPQEFAALLARKVRADHLLHLIVLGAPEDREVVEASLSRDVSARVIACVDSVPPPGSPVFREAVHGALQAYERRAEAAGLARLLRLREDGQEIAVGVPATLEAINRGKLRVLYVLQSLIPAPRVNLVRYHGAFAPASPLRPLVVPRSLSEGCPHGAGMCSTLAAPLSAGADAQAPSGTEARVPAAPQTPVSSARTGA